MRRRELDAIVRGEPGVLAQYLKRGQAIDAGSRPTTFMRLAEAVEVQAK